MFCPKCGVNAEPPGKCSACGTSMPSRVAFADLNSPFHSYIVSALTVNDVAQISSHKQVETSTAVKPIAMIGEVRKPRWQMIDIALLIAVCVTMFVVGVLGVFTLDLSRKNVQINIPMDATLLTGSSATNHAIDTAPTITSEAVTLTPLPTQAPPTSDWISTKSVTELKNMKVDAIYATPQNITGAALTGYKVDELWITPQLRVALIRANKAAENAGYTIVLHDAGRHEQAVEMLMNWINSEAVGNKSCYPFSSKKTICMDTNLYDQNDYAKGKTVDVTLALNGKPVDMGGKYGVYQGSAKTESNIRGIQSKNRNLLMQIMAEGGFKQDRNLWWKFTLNDDVENKP